MGSGICSQTRRFGQYLKAGADAGESSKGVLRAGDLVVGPGILIDETQTVVVDPGWQLGVMERGVVLKKVG